MQHGTSDSTLIAGLGIPALEPEITRLGESTTKTMDLEGLAMITVKQPEKTATDIPD